MRRAVFTMLMVTAVAGVGCGPKSEPVAPVTDASVVGVYSLRIVNGGNLPFPVAGNATEVLEITGGTITLNADHTFTDALNTRLTYSSGNPPPSETVSTQTGTYVLVNRNIAMAYAAGTDTAAVTPNQLTKNNAGLLLTYSK